MNRFLCTIIFSATVLLMYSCTQEYYTPKELKVQFINNQTLSDVIPINDTLVTPIIYSNLLISPDSSPSERKQQFINQVLPAILIVKFRYEEQLKVIEDLILKVDSGLVLSIEKQQLIDSLMITFRANSHENLLMRLKPHSTSLVLAQAALESGWGSSKTSQEGFNLFGIWTTATDSNVIVSRHKASNKRVYMKRYDTLVEAVDHYFLTLGRNDAYREFHKKRYTDHDVFELIKTLNRYSELRSQYTQKLRIMVKYNNFEIYDNYIINPEHVITYSEYDIWKSEIKSILKKNRKKPIENDEISTDSITFEPQ
jgi:Bax protein